MAAWRLSGGAPELLPVLVADIAEQQQGVGASWGIEEVLEPGAVAPEAVLPQQRVDLLHGCVCPPPAGPIDPRRRLVALR